MYKVQCLANNKHSVKVSSYYAIKIWGQQKNIKVNLLIMFISETVLAFP